jgi:hypothetical protein
MMMAAQLTLQCQRRDGQAGAKRPAGVASSVKLFKWRLGQRPSRQGPAAAR